MSAVCLYNGLFLRWTAEFCSPTGGSFFEAQSARGEVKTARLTVFHSAIDERLNLGSLIILAVTAGAFLLSIICMPAAGLEPARPSRDKGF